MSPAPMMYARHCNASSRTSRCYRLTPKSVRGHRVGHTQGDLAPSVAVHQVMCSYFDPSGLQGDAQAVESPSERPHTCLWMRQHPGRQQGPIRGKDLPAIRIVIPTAISVAYLDLDVESARFTCRADLHPQDVGHPAERRLGAKQTADQEQVAQASPNQSITGSHCTTSSATCDGANSKIPRPVSAARM